MKTFFILIAFMASEALGQDSLKTVKTVFYFGGSDCVYCVDPKNVENINAMRVNLPKTYKDVVFKFVLVVMDENLKEGIKYADKYPSWDELSIGQFYNNELMLAYLNRSSIPGVPHIMIYNDVLNLHTNGHSVPTIEKRTLLVDLVGERSIQGWIQQGFPLKK